MNLDFLEKYSIQINSLILLFLVSFIYRFFTANNIYVLGITVGIYLYAFYSQVNLVSKGFFIKIALYCYIIADLIAIFLGRFNMKYILFTVIVFAFLYILTNITEGKVAVKKLSIFLIAYTIIKLLYILFLLY